MRVLGIDPGSNITGYGIVEQQGNRLFHIDNGCIVTSTKSPLHLRLKEIYSGLQEIIQRYEPEAVSIENIFFSVNAGSALKLGQARGAAILSAVNADKEVFEYTPMQVKSAVVGYGKASKDQVQKMTKVLLNLPEVAQADAADALAVAICHINSAKILNAVRGKK
ncbi:MAG: crossover junction endodeoxyribonuclease RuvC [Deltaproteobacteria bacterium]|nr:crossover junction endodeoxyribonuclease RuvC [Deltaproteobacteria bacterium]